MIMLRRGALGVLAVAFMTCLLAGCEENGESGGDEGTRANSGAGAAKQAASDQPLESEEPGTEVVVLQVNGMHCSGCAGIIQKDLSQLEGVRKASVSFDQKKAWVMIDKESGPSVSDLIGTVAEVDEAYTATRVEAPTTQPGES